MSENSNPNLMFCPDCGKQVSRRAGTCPQCGCPLQKQAKITVNIPDTKVQVQTIEKTGKKWKGMKLFGILAILFGIVGGVNAEAPVLAVGSILIGVVLLFASKAGAWWYHD